MTNSIPKLFTQKPFDRGKDNNYNRKYCFHSLLVVKEIK